MATVPARVAASSGEERPAVTRRSSQGISPLTLVAIGTAAIALAAVVATDRAVRRGDAPLAFAGPAVERITQLGGALRTAGDAALPVLAIPAGLLLLAAAAWRWRRGRDPGDGTALGLALGLALLAQLAVLRDATWLGIALYAVAAAVALRGRSDPGPVDAPLSARVEVGSYLLVMALFVALCIHRMDVFPKLYFDEVAFLTAARMWLGEIEPGPIVTPPFPALYGYERFQAQAIPLALQAGAVAALSPGVHAIRVASLVASLAALWLGAWTLRRQLGPRLALLATALCAFNPLFLAYSRQGTYLSVSTLHGVACVAALLHHAERRDRGTAALLGAVLGASLYLYQLSWFAPVLAGGAWLMVPALRARDGMRTLMPLALAFMAVALPGVTVLGPGLRDVAAQTFDARASWIERPRLEASATIDAELDTERWTALRERIGGGEIGVLPMASPPGRSALRITGPAEELDRASAELEADGWTVKRSARSIAATAPPWERLGTMLRQHFRDPGYESAGRRVTEPLLTPLLSGLAVLGLVVALRRRVDPVWRVLAVWVVGAALLPGTIGTPFPRRSVLIFPFAQAMMALPLLALAAGRARNAPAARTLGALTAVLVLVVAATGSDGYFRHWYVPTDESGDPLTPSAMPEGGRERPSRDGFLGLAKLVKQLPPDEVVLVAPLYTGLDAIFRQVEAQPDADGQAHVVVRRRAKTAAVVLGSSCQRRPPFTWVTEDSPAQRRLFRVLEGRFAIEENLRPPYRLLRVVGRRRDACPEAAGSVER